MFFECGARIIKLTEGAGDETGRSPVEALPSPSSSPAPVFVRHNGVRQYGFRVGTRSHYVAVLLTRKPMSVKELQQGLRKKWGAQVGQARQQLVYDTLTALRKYGFVLHRDRDFRFFLDLSATDEKVRRQHGG